MGRQSSCPSFPQIFAGFDEFFIIHSGLGRMPLLATDGRISAIFMKTARQKVVEVEWVTVI